MVSKIEKLNTILLSFRQKFHLREVKVNRFVSS
jgi:hypothetical protein